MTEQITAFVPGLIDAHFHAYAARLSLLEIETSPLSYLALAGAKRLAGRHQPGTGADQQLTDCGH